MISSMARAGGDIGGEADLYVEARLMLVLGTLDLRPL